MHPTPSHNPYQHYRKHSPTSYDDIVDPYRRHKSQPSDSNSADQGVLHSRTASDSSTTRLATNAAPYSHGFTTRDYDDDPYAKSRLPAHINTTSNNNTILMHTINNIHSNKENETSNTLTTLLNNNITDKDRIMTATNPVYMESQQRANSYLPYSHHYHDLSQPIAPIYVEDERSQTMQGVGSMLQDNISVDMAPQQVQAKLTIDSHYEKTEPPRRNEQKRGCGLTIRQWRYVSGGGFLVLFALLMYFFVPRMPTVKFSAAATSQKSWAKDMNTMTAQWAVNMTLDNSANWIPVWLNSMVVSVLDNDTMTQIGSGSVDAQWINQREKKHLVTLPITIAYSRTNATDETITDLFATCGPYRQTPNPIPYQVELFNVTFQVDLSVRGIPWYSHSTVFPEHGIQCPG
ncbi:hypothetical protein BC941DRAFT_412121 [Chlamydoabsidia padenii]|nr:hypothetical protein BC941DRAFT_412121 [Chlamydoabsidia padenii]